MSTPPEDNPARSLAGSCLCEAVGYEVKDEFIYAYNCHCSQCRRATGAAYKPFAGIQRSKLRLVKGYDELLMFSERDSHDVHCKRCGSFLYSVVREGQYLHVNLGTLQDNPSLTPTAHVFVGSKAPWHTITDSLPQFQAAHD